MTAPELRLNLERLFGWLQVVEAAPEPVLRTPGLERSLESVREAANRLLEEQRERHSDESAPRGG